MATAKKAVKSFEEGLKAAKSKLAGSKGSSREHFNAEVDKLKDAGKAKTAAKAGGKGAVAEKAADPDIPKPMGQNPGGDYKPTLADKAGKTASEALRLLEGLPAGGAAIKGGRAALALAKAKAGTEVARRTNVAVKTEKAGELATRTNLAKRAADDAPKAKPKKYDNSGAEDAKYSSDRPKLPAPAAKSSTGSKVAAGAAVASAVGAAALSGGRPSEAKDTEKVATGKANANTKLTEADIKTAAKATGADKAKSGDKPVGMKGDYPVYKKDSATAADFRKAFASARKEGKSVFTWQGRKYNTKLKGN